MNTPITLGYAITGSFCTIERSLQIMSLLKSLEYNIIPIISESVAHTDTRFGRALDTVRLIEGICGTEVISTLRTAEPIGPKKLLDALLILPCTGNTIAKIAAGITDTPVTLAAKAHLRNQRPLIIAVSSNDALSANAKNIGALLNTRNVYFVPMKQDDPAAKPRSIVSDFDRAQETVEAALKGEQLQPIFS